MQLNHCTTPEAALEYTVGCILWDLREDLAGMIGSQAERYTDAEVAEVENMIADIEAASRL